MTLCTEQISDALRLRFDGPERWGTPLGVRQPGVYVIALGTEPSDRGLFQNAPLDLSVVNRWLNRSPLLTLDGVQPTVQVLAERLGSFWLPNETIVYVGKSGRPLGQRIAEFYVTELGDRRPHAGGSWVKAMSILQSLAISWVALDSPATAEVVERRLLHLFGTYCATSSARHSIPFGNLESYTLVDGIFRRVRKPHGLKNWKSG